MKYEDKKTLVISLMMIVILSVFSYRNIINVEMPDRPPTPIKAPDLNIPSFEEMLSGEYLSEEILSKIDPNKTTSDEVTYVSKIIDDQFKFKYPSDWKVVESKKKYEKIDPLFLAISIKNINKPTLIAVSKIYTDNPESVINIMKEVFSREGTEMTITKKEDAYFEANYKHSDGRVAVSKEKIISVRDNYLVSVITFEDQAIKDSEQMEKIIQSIQIIE